MRPCKACGLEHNPGLRCEVARRAALAYPPDSPGPRGHERMHIVTQAEPTQLSADWVEVPGSSVTVGDVKRCMMTDGAVTIGLDADSPTPTADPPTEQPYLNATYTVVKEAPLIPQTAKPEPTVAQIVAKQAKKAVVKALVSDRVECARAAKVKRNAYMAQYMAKRRAATQAGAAADAQENILADKKT